MIDIHELLGRLSIKREIFHSECDFQHALAWEFHASFPDIKVRLEKRADLLDKPTYFDILLSDGEQQTVIELKYKTRALFAVVNNELYWLKDQSAQDIGRYDYLKDVERLESFVSKYEKACGYALILTNDSSYWKAPGITNPVDAKFRIHESEVIMGQLGWGERASAGTMAGRKRMISLNNRYVSEWRDYSILESSKIQGGNYPRFRYLCLEVK